MTKKVLGILCVILGIAALVIAFGRKPAVNPDPNHTHADFAVWVNGTQLDFSGAAFMSEELTAAEEEELKNLNAPVGQDIASMKKYLHLHDGNGHVIHRHKPGLSLLDALRAMGIEVRVKKTDQEYLCLKFPQLPEETCESPWHNFTLYINDPAQGGARFLKDDYVFNDGDKLLIILEDASASDYVTTVHSEWQKMTDDACLYSRTCPERGEPPTENCIADPTVPCTQ